MGRALAKGVPRQKIFVENKRLRDESAESHYGINFNHPDPGTNQGRDFEVTANRPDLDSVRLTVQYGPNPVGFHIDLGYGKTMDIVNANEPGPGVLPCLPQAFAMWKPVDGKNLQLEFGKFAVGRAPLRIAVFDPVYSKDRE